MAMEGTLVRETQAPELAIPVAAPSLCEARLDEIISEGLPTLPSYVFELDARLKATPVVWSDIAWLVGVDPCLTAQVLRVCHTMPFATPVLSIDAAIAIAGEARLRAIALTSPLFLEPQIRGRRGAAEARRATRHLFWQHSPWIALLSERIAEWTGYPDPARAYTAGLLHDIGKVPLMLEGITTDSTTEQSNHYVAIGKLLAEAWHYPPILIEALEFHGCPRRASLDPALTGIVAAADQYSERSGSGEAAGSHGPPPEANEISGLLRDCLPALSLDDAARVAAQIECELPSMLVTLGRRLSCGYSSRQRF